jgi:hypothetical protein
MGEGITNLNQVDVNIKWSSDLSRMMSHYDEAPNSLTGIEVEFVQTPQLLVNYLTPDNSYPLPLLQLLSYSKVNDFIKRTPSIAAGENFEVISDTIKLNQIPRHLMLFCKRSLATQTFKTTDTFARINNINILWNNESSLLSTYAKQGLYDITQHNGCDITYPQYDKFTGSVFRLSFGSDIGLFEGLAPGVCNSAEKHREHDISALSCYQTLVY